MELINATRMVAQHNLGMLPSGRELLVVVIKGTFVLPGPGEAVRLHDVQRPLTTADTFTGAPGLSAPVYEVDFAPRKSQCDVLVLGSAHAPGGRPVTRMQLGLQVGGLRKQCDVVGPRVWQAGLTGIKASAPEAFMQLPISYDTAFGGMDQASDDPLEHDAYLPNPAGRGFHKHLKNEWVDGRPLPFTEEVGQSITWPTNAYAPMAFGPVGRGWPQRACFGGTYDQAWQENQFPFLPADFDERYFQAASADQQLPLPNGPLDVVLSGWTPDGLRHFTLPYFEAPIHIFPRKGKREDHVAKLDTIVFEPDDGILTMTWRMCRPLRHSLHEVAQVLVGKQGREWWQQREHVGFPIPVVMVPMHATQEAT